MGHNSEFRCVRVSREHRAGIPKSARSQRLLNDSSFTQSWGGYGRTWSGSVLDGRLIFWPLSQREWASGFQEEIQRRWICITDQTQFGRGVFWPVTTSVAIKKSSTNHVHQTFQMSGSKLDIYENIFSHIVFPIHYASCIIFQVHWFDSWLERKIPIFLKSWPQR